VLRWCGVRSFTGANASSFLSLANAFSQFQVAGVLPQSHAIRAGKTTLTMRHAQPQKLNPKNLLQNTLAKNSNLQYG